MKTIKYGCSHCGKKFEAEEKEIVECPGCFWTSSVKPEEDLLEAASRPSSGDPSGLKPSFRLKLPALPWKLMGFGLAGILILFLIIKVFVPLALKAGETAKSAVSKPFQGNSGKKEKQTQAPALAETTLPLMAKISVEEQNILKRRIQVSVDRQPSEEETRILSTRADFKTGFSERLPSQPWTIENFKEMISQQEKFYQILFPRSYKKKLESLFQEKYLAGAEAFKSGDLLQARNFWVESLAFPQYSTNLQKHRGVALTMVRPFITDTLSKIGAINNSIVERSIREKEEKVVKAYDGLFALIQEKSWKQSLDLIAGLHQEINSLASPQKVAGGPGAYPAGMAQVDADIQATLTELLTVPPPPVSDLEPVLQDILSKKRVIESFMPGSLDLKQNIYKEAVEFLERGEWAKAEKKFREIDAPLELLQDAAEKIKILKKLQKISQTPSESSEPRSSEKTHEANR